ncbi:SRPBCC domain-containing protein [Paenarthrobacter sp. PH39-S1]|uniref:SRPBCC family protein n=1 Tax=Paenarthrobacter sp. PH39-S1 TaxID=3046204 RepID=UPI0024B88FB5|nr:SRPBCC domain-containing protein [Paenarthrobacter sp. PH39-S1]MDJ0356648.1 SRPBCC domain-containing protein [Paenarthrobacter sp. PH39-S1]
MSEASRREVTERDVFVSRAFAAPRDIVWRFWTKPELLASWFGPEGVTVPIESVTVDLVEDGRWELSMVDDSTGAANPIRGRIVSFQEPEYLEIRMKAKTAAGEVDDIILRLEFHDHGERTRMTLHQGPFTDEIRDMTLAGWVLSFAKLDTILERYSA